MRRPVHLGMFLLALAAGCSPAGPDLTKTSPPPPHGGEEIMIPGGLGFVEIVNEPPARVAKGKASTTVVSIYFLKPDATTPIDPPPSDATLTLTLADGEKDVALKAPAQGEPGLLQTPPGNYGQGTSLSGDLKATINGQAVTIPILTR